MACVGGGESCKFVIWVQSGRGLGVGRMQVSWAESEVSVTFD